MIQSPMRTGLGILMLLSTTTFGLTAQSIIYVRPANAPASVWEGKSSVVATSLDQLQLSANTHYWFAAGTYSIPRTVTLPQGSRFIGGFSGSESSLEERVREDLNNNSILEPWEMANPTLFVGSSSATTRMLSLSNANTLLDGVMLTKQAHGGGALLSNATAKITNCHFDGVITSASTLYANQDGGAVRATAGTIDHSLFENCQAHLRGGAIHASNATITHSIVRNCRATGNGGGFYLGNNATLYYNLIHNNTAASGGGIALNGSLCSFAHLTVANNASTSLKQGGRKNTAGILLEENQNTLTMRNMLIVGNDKRADNRENYNFEKIVKNSTVVGSHIAIEGGYDELTKEQRIDIRLDSTFYSATSFAGYTTNEKNLTELAVSDWNLHRSAPETLQAGYNGSFPNRDLAGCEVPVGVRSVGAYQTTQEYLGRSIEIDPNTETYIEEEHAIFRSIVFNINEDGKVGSLLSSIKSSSVDEVMINQVVTPGQWYGVTFPFKVSAIVIGDDIIDPTYFESFRMRGFSSSRFEQGFSNYYGDIASSDTSSHQSKAEFYLPRIGVNQSYIFALNRNTYGPEPITVCFYGNVNANSILQQECSEFIPATQPLTDKNRWHRNWNLVSNPFPTKYDIKAAGYDALVWNGGSYVLTEELKPFQSFFTQVCDETHQLELSNLHRVANLAQRKNARIAEEREEPIQLTVGITQNGKADRTIFRLEEELSMYYTVGQDLSKLNSLDETNTAPQICSLKEGGDMYLQSANEELLNNGVTLRAQPATKGWTEIKIDQNSFVGFEHIYLTDNATGYTHDLLTGSYAFEAQPKSYDFRLRAVSTPLSNGDIDQSRIQITTQSGIVTLHNLAEGATATLFDLTGKRLEQLVANGAQTVSFDAQANPVVIVEILHNGLREQHKVAIN